MNKELTKAHLHIISNSGDIEMILNTLFNYYFLLGDEINSSDVSRLLKEFQAGFLYHLEKCCAVHGEGRIADCLCYRGSIKKKFTNDIINEWGGRHTGIAKKISISYKAKCFHQLIKGGEKNER